MSSNPNAPAAPLGSLVDKLTIETPEQTALDFAVAGIGSRFIAIGYDMLIQIVVGVAVGIGSIFLFRALALVSSRASLWGLAILILFYFLLYFGYYALFEIIWNGQTPGKRRVGIRVIKDSGRPLTPAESIGRNLMRIVDWLPSLYGVGLVSAVLTKENKRLGDLLVGSLVVRETSLSDLKPAFQNAPAPTGLAASPLGADRLTPEEFVLIDSFLNRRSALDSYVRSQMAGQILNRLRPKLTLPTDNPLSTERILESVAYERRATGRYS
jgi:uncharacterized RDD family membrane protein YckC